MLFQTHIFFVCLIVTLSNGLLDDILHHYEIIDRQEFHTITKRSTGYDDKHLEFTALGRDFYLRLNQSRNLFTGNFKITVVHGDNSKETVGLSKNTFYHGFVEEKMMFSKVEPSTTGLKVCDFTPTSIPSGVTMCGDPDSKVALQIDEDDVITGSIITHGEEFVIEPSRHFENEDGDNGMIVVYRKSEVKTDKDNPDHCAALHVDEADESDIQGDEDQIHKQDKTESENSRHKRFAGPELKSCRIIAVADYRFYVHRGQSNIFNTANFIGNIVNRLNLIYRGTGFSGGTGYGIELDQMTIHDGYSTQLYEYNYNRVYGTSDLLAAFSRFTGNSVYCLAHLFTSQAMPDSVLGLAYIASPNVGSPGGICSPTGSFQGAASTFNTGWTSSLNGAGNTLTFIQNALVTAHGHSWGSEHDPDSSGCSPRTFLGGDGKYLMYASSVTGEDPNNDKFSSCSIGSISAVLANKAMLCFSVPSVETLCGNGRIDQGEECDGGFLGSVGLDPCCRKDCTLSEGAQCSAANYPCCANCQLASPGLVCRGNLAETCDLEATCDGQSFTCPSTGFKADNTPCLDGGSCIGGVCTPFCEVRNRNSCLCDTVETSCRKCCRDPNTGFCSVYDNAVLVADGRSCIQGYCENGNCIKVASNTVERLWDLIDKVSINFLIESFKTNIVLCVTGFSLILYIPLCIGIWCYDRKRRDDWIKENTIHVRKDRNLAHDEDKRPVVSNKPHLNSKPATLDPSEYLEPINRRSSPSNRIQPLNHRSSTSVA